jgi:hypothetical protein
MGTTTVPAKKESGVDVKFRMMDHAKQSRGKLLLFPSRKITPPEPSQGCPECERLARAHETAINEIKSATRGAGSLGQMLARMHQNQDERDRAISVLYSHKQNAHAKRTA